MNAPLKCHQKDADLRQKFNDTQYGQKSLQSIIYSMTTTSCKLYPILPAVYPSKEYLPPFIPS